MRLYEVIQELEKAGHAMSGSSLLIIATVIKKHRCFQAHGSIPRLSPVMDGLLLTELRSPITGHSAGTGEIPRYVHTVQRLTRRNR